MEEQTKAASGNATTHIGSGTIAMTTRTRLKRLPKRASYDRDVIDALLDAALVCHVGFAIDGQPYVIPTLQVRIGDRLYIHGSAASRMLGNAADGTPLAVTVTHIDDRFDTSMREKLGADAARVGAHRLAQCGVVQRAHVRGKRRAIAR